MKTIIDGFSQIQPIHLAGVFCGVSLIAVFSFAVAFARARERWDKGETGFWEMFGGAVVGLIATVLWCSYVATWN